MVELPRLLAQLEPLLPDEGWFEAGRYNPLNPFPLDFDLNQSVKEIEPDVVSSKSIEEAIEAAMESGTRSILDINKVADEPGPGIATSIPSNYLSRFFRTDQPTREMVEASLFEEYPEMEEEEDVEYYEDGIIDIYDLVSRGFCRQIIIYENNHPSEICFFWYSWD